MVDEEIIQEWIESQKAYRAAEKIRKFIKGKLK
jgi:hypothetical protein